MSAGIHTARIHAPARAVPARPALRWLTALLAAIAVISGALTTTPAQAATTATALTVDLNGVFSDNAAGRTPTRDKVVGTVASALRTNEPGFTLAAPCAVTGTGSSCAALSAAGTNLTWHWDLGDGRTRTTTADNLGGPVRYTRPGRYTVKVTVDNNAADGSVPADAYAGAGTLQVLVAPRFADADAAVGTKAAPADSDSIWAVAALGLLDPCGTFLPQAGQYLANQDTGDTGRALFCPKAPALTAAAANTDTAAIRLLYNEDYATTTSTTFNRGQTSATAVTGVGGAHDGAALRYRSSTGEVLWAQASTSIAYQPAQLYKVSARVRVRADATNGVARTVRVGVTAKNSAGQPLLRDGTVQSGYTDTQLAAQHWVAANGATVQAADGWVTYTGYLKGTAATGTAGTTTRSAPGAFVTGTTTFTPAIVVNEGPGAGDATWDIDYLKVEAVTATGTDTTAGSFTTNGITGTDCLSAAAACDLPATAWANNNTGANVSTTCNTACVQELFDKGYLTSTANPQVRYRNDVCGDNRTFRPGTGEGTGVEDGCVSYADFATALTRALDNGTKTGVQLSADPSCTNASPGVRRLFQLLSSSPAAAAMSGLVRCTNETAAITKAEAYGLLAAATGTELYTNSNVDGFRDLAAGGTNLTSGPYGATTQADVLTGLLDAGAPVVGTLSCPDRALRSTAGQDPGTCFNGGTTLTRAQASRMLGWLVLGATPSTTDTKVTIRPGTVSVAAGERVSVDVTADFPAWFPTSTTATPTWTGGNALNRMDCGTLNRSIGDARQAQFRCTFIAEAATGPSGQLFTVTVANDQGAVAGQGTFTAVVSNDPPMLGEGFATNVNEGDTMTIKVPFREPQDSAVTFGVRSCVPAVDGTCVSSAATFPRAHGSSRVQTSDTTPAAFVSDANTDVGVVTLAGSTHTTVTLTVTLSDPDNNGDFDFVLQACDTGNACTTKYLRQTFTPVNDRPQATSLISVSAGAAGNTFTLTGTDTHDVNQPGYPSPNSPLDQYMVCNIPAGWDVYWVNADGSTTAATNLVPSSVPTVKVVPQSSSAGSTTTMKFNVRDVGQGAVAGDKAWANGDPSTCTGALGSVQLTSTLPLPAPTNVVQQWQTPSPTQVSVSWDAVPNAVSYNVLVRTCVEDTNVESAAARTCTPDNNLPRTLIATTPSLSYTVDSGLRGTWYSFAVSANDARGVEGSRAGATGNANTIPLWPTFATFTSLQGNYYGWYERINVTHASTSQSLAIDRLVGPTGPAGTGQGTSTWSLYADASMCSWNGANGGGGAGTAWQCSPDKMTGWTLPKMGHDYFFRGWGCDPAGCDSSPVSAPNRVPWSIGITSDQQQYGGTYWWAQGNYDATGALNPDDGSITRLTSAPSSNPTLYTIGECPPFRACTGSDHSVLLKAPVAYPATCPTLGQPCRDGAIFTNNAYHAIPTGAAARTWEFFYKQYGTWGADHGWFSQGNDASAAGWGMKSGTTSTSLQWIDGTAIPGTYNYADGSWHLYDITFDGASTVKVYEDGTLKGTITKAINTPGTPYPANQDLLGVSMTTSTGMAGWYDEWSVWKAALPATTIAEHWAGRADG